MLHGNMINLKNFIRTLMCAGGALLLIVVMSGFSEDSPDPEYTKVMQVFTEEDKSTAYSGGGEVVFETSLESSSELTSEAQVKSSFELAKQQIKVGFAEVEYALRLVKLDSFGQLILNDKTEASLNRAVARLPADLPEDEIAHIQALIQTSLPGEAGAQVADVFTKYYRYKVTEKALVMNSPAPDSVDTALEQLATVADLRYEIMGDEYAEKLFGTQQRRAEYYLESEIIREDSTLTVEEQSQKLTQLTVAAEKNGLAISSPSAQVQQLNADVNEMRSAGLNEAMIQERRAQTVGKDAAKQLGLMEAQQNDWQLRYQQFEQEKQLILAAVLDAGDQQKQVDSLFLRHYSAEELAGARAYDQHFAH